jgi:hypothetical protein
VGKFPKFSRKTLVRKLAPAALLAAVLILAGETCAADAADVELSFDFGGAEFVDAHVELYRLNEPDLLGYYNITYGGPMRPWPVQTETGDYVLKAVITRASGKVAVEKHVTFRSRARLTVKFEDDLSAAQSD